jgi:hypothetical protein
MRKSVFFCFGITIVCASSVFSQTVDQKPVSISAPAEAGRRLMKEIKHVRGPESKWFTDNDPIYHYYAYEYDNDGRVSKKITESAGSDGLVSTSDDEIQNWLAFAYDKNGRMTGEIFFKNPGPDTKWFTPDDIRDYDASYEYDAQGRKSRMIRRNPDQETTRVMTFAYAPEGKLIQDVEYTGAGPDKKWLTADDSIEKYHRFEYDEHGHMSRAMEYLLSQNGKGGDGVWFTPDDVISSTKEFFYECDGTRTREKKYIGSGADGVWFTADDILQYYVVYHYSDD